MKKRFLALCLVLALALALTPACLAAEDNYDTLADWDIKIAVPPRTTAVLKGNSYYIYAQKAGYIPYVMLNVYRYDSEEAFIDDFTEYMRRQYPDLTVTAGPEKKVIGDKTCWEIDYAYKISGYDATDRRIVINANDRTYMFASKEIESRGMTVGSLLEDVVADCVFLPEEGNDLPALEESPALASAYLYRQKDGMPKYWLDFTGVMAENLVLHCYFRSGEPTFYETCYILDLATADIDGDRVTIRKVYDVTGAHDLSRWFKELTVVIREDGITMTVKRNEQTLAGGGEDNLLTGTYRMEPVGADLVYEYRQKDGQLKYWIYPHGDDVLLHCNFRSGDPTWYEEVFVLDADTAEYPDEYTMKVRKVFTSDGVNVSRWFKALTLTEIQGALLMNVTRDDRTLAGGADDNILTGVYMLEPRTYLIPGEGGPYSADELAAWAQIYYFRHNGFYPPAAEAEKNADGTVTVHLFEVMELDGVSHTATSAWYTVDVNGVGINAVTEESVNLFE